MASREHEQFMPGKMFEAKLFRVVIPGGNKWSNHGSSPHGEQYGKDADQRPEDKLTLF
jgi:hypothetical protein